MKIISFLNHKGGVGKTTLCTNIARAILSEDPIVNLLLVDSDPQGSLRDWHNATDISDDRINLVAADRKSALAQLPELVTSFRPFNYALIDTPGKMHELHGTALNLSDLVVIPIRPSPYDIWATEDTIELVKLAKAHNPKLKAAILINQAIPNTLIHKEVAELLHQYKDDFHIVPFHICHRVSFARSASTGHTVFDVDAVASTEIINVTTSLLDYLFERI